MRLDPRDDGRARRMGVQRREPGGAPRERPPVAPADRARDEPRAPSTEALRDVALVIGGSFSVDHLGPDAFGAVRARVRADPAAALDALDAIVASSPPDVLATTLRRLTADW